MRNPSSKSYATLEKKRRKPQSPGLLSARHTAPNTALAQRRPVSAVYPWLATLGGVEKEMDLLPPLLFCAYGNLYSQSEAQEHGPEQGEKIAAEKIKVHQRRE